MYMCMCLQYGHPLAPQLSLSLLFLSLSLYMCVCVCVEALPPQSRHVPLACVCVCIMSTWVYMCIISVCIISAPVVCVCIMSTFLWRALYVYHEHGGVYVYHKRLAVCECMRACVSSRCHVLVV